MLPNPLAVNTWIKFKNYDCLYHDYRRGDKVLFMGRVTNSGHEDDAVVMDDRGIRVIHLHLDDWEII